VTDPRRNGILIRAQVENFGACSLLRLAYLRRQQRDELRNLALRVVQVTGNNRLYRADDHAGRLQATFHAMRTVVALFGHAPVGLMYRAS